ncbi:hypothetical protein CLOP_g11185 [Closterium sp. NIES-67]|nr:hypothetical protein CLOP_g11185 [Closterium sp. NIES-67]
MFGQPWSPRLSKSLVWENSKAGDWEVASVGVRDSGRAGEQGYQVSLVWAFQGFATVRNFPFLTERYGYRVRSNTPEASGLFQTF